MSAASVVASIAPRPAPTAATASVPHAKLNKRKPENHRKYFDPERVDPPSQPHAPASPVAAPVPAAPVTLPSPAMPATLLADIIKEDSTLPAGIIPAYFPARQKTPLPPAEEPGHVSPTWDAESKSSTPEAEELPHTPTHKTSPPSAKRYSTLGAWTALQIT
ncbi:hypothetical protein FRC12_018455 [Ceratobasidium sp. 428]|nr:hypothetical protein FRC12_018455 [Ceratobasidium sp. 428]